MPAPSTIERGTGQHQCWATAEALALGGANASYCGASFDARGNARFTAGWKVAMTWHRRIGSRNNEE